MSLKDQKLVDIFSINKRQAGGIPIGDPLFFIYEKILNGQSLDDSERAFIQKERDEIFKRFQDIGAEVAHGEHAMKLPSRTI